MGRATDTPLAIEPAQAAVGLYVWLDDPWADHPFLTSRFMIRTQEDLSTVRASAPRGRLYYYPALSEAQAALPRQADGPATPAQASAQDTGDNPAATEDALAVAREAKLERQRRQAQAAQRAKREWERAVGATRDALGGLSRSPRAAGQQLDQLAGQAARTVAHSGEILLHLLSERDGKGPQYHALNTMTLSLLLGRAAGLGETELRDLALAALAHDCGEADLPTQILMSSRRRKFEEDYFRRHVAMGVELARCSGVFSAGALEIMAGHHEAMDGAGWPAGIRNPVRGARILALVDRFDRLCTPQASDVLAMMPTEALGTMFRFEAGRYDKSLLGLLIRLLGVYPPGTIVQLSDGSLGLVVSPGPTSLQPTVVLYTPELSRDEAPMVDLAAEPHLKIREAVRPNGLAAHVLDWMSPQRRLSYYFSAEPSGT